MIRKHNEMIVAEQTGVMGGTGTIRMVNILQNEELYGVGRLFAVTIIPPGCSTGRHTHQGDFETYYILRGNAGVDDNGVYHELGPGDVMQCKDGDFHSIRNIGSCDLEYIAVILFSRSDPAISPSPRLRDMCSPSEPSHSAAAAFQTGERYRAHSEIRRPAE